MEKIKDFLVDNWKAKLVSLLIATSIWYLIRSHLDGERREFPVPGTGMPTSTPARPATTPPLEESLLGPLIPAPVTIPVPGGEPKG
ncbi:MAG: hypothetical protein KDN18_20150 [Verrucomicrobiae bacterium]|nr:hypothetical protein [Verrucomicrobiae bacterium]